MDEIMSWQMDEMERVDSGKSAREAQEKAFRTQWLSQEEKEMVRERQDRAKRKSLKEVERKEEQQHRREEKRQEAKEAKVQLKLLQLKGLEEKSEREASAAFQLKEMLRLEKIRDARREESRAVVRQRQERAEQESEQREQNFAHKLKKACEESKPVIYEQEARQAVLQDYLQLRIHQKAVKASKALVVTRLGEVRKDRNRVPDLAQAVAEATALCGPEYAESMAAKKAKKLIAKHQVTFDAIEALTKAIEEAKVSELQAPLVAALAAALAADLEEDHAEVVRAKRLINKMYRADVIVQKTRRFAAQMIQRAFRCRLARIVAWKLRQQRDLELQAEARRLAAIQKMAEDKQEAAVKLQSLFRASRDRTIVHAIRDKERAKAEGIRLKQWEKARAVMLIQQEINAAMAELRTLILLYVSGAGASQYAGVMRCGGFNEMARRLRTGIFRAQQVGAPLTLTLNLTLNLTLTLTRTRTITLNPNPNPLTGASVAWAF